MSLSDRCGPPGNDDMPIRCFQCDFGMPVYITSADQRDLHLLFSRIVGRPANQPMDGVHWLSGSGSKPCWSKADSAFLGIRGEPDAPESGEPTFDDEIFYFESTAREFVSQKERDRTTKERIGGGRKDQTLTADEEGECKELSRDLFGEGEEPLTPGQFLAVKCVVDERDSATEVVRELWKWQATQADLLPDGLSDRIRELLGE